MGFTDISTVESHGKILVIATKETTLVDQVVADKEQLINQMAELDAKKADLQLLLDAINAAPAPVDPGGVVVTP